MNTKDFIRLGVPLGEATRRANGRKVEASAVNARSDKSCCQVRELDDTRWPAPLLPRPIRWGERRGEGFSVSSVPRSPLSLK